jgi:hypothetical protein
MIQLRYRPTSLFHFKRLDSTNKGALTLPMPTPYAVRCALLAVSDDPEVAFDKIKAKKIIVTPPAEIVHNPCWVKILDLKRSEFRPQWDKPEATAEYQSTMSLREYAYIPADGSSDLLIYIDTLDGIEELPARINYFGKRGSFVQFIGKEDNAEPYLPLEGMECTLQDFSNKATWENVNVYTTKKSVREKLNQFIEPKLIVRGVKHTYYKFI